jgi:hypothetical protein
MKKSATHKRDLLQNVCSAMHFAGAWRNWPRVAAMPVNVTAHSLYTGCKGIR